jgi:hypothetical protein
VRSQQGVEFTHLYIEASEQEPARTKVENLREAIATLSPDTVCACLDGDDWLAGKYALRRIAVAHASGKWATYGSFRNSDGSPGFADAYGPGEAYRTSHWRATHLKTFRAGLFQRIADVDLQYPADAGGRCVPFGDHVAMRWIDRADDPAFMYPILEMAGYDRTEYVRDITYIYNEVGGWHRSASQAELEHQATIMALTRSRPAYGRIEAL